MGSTQSLSEITSGTYSSVDQLPPGHAPPPAPQIVSKAKELAAKHFSYHNPTGVKALQQGAKQAGYSTERLSMANSLRQMLSGYASDAKPYTDRVYQLTAPDSRKLNVWVSSNKNSDHTVSYWVLYPVHDMHIRAAMLKLMNISIDPENLADISTRYRGLYKQVSQMLHGKTIKCEQIDPLYMNNILKSLVLQGYTPQKLKLQ